ncbi:MAG: response regulator [Planctomycetota bacterium]
MARILVAEDEPHIAHVTSLWLRQHGHQVSHAENGRVAMTLLQDGSFEVIISDMNMPEVNGMQLLRAVREQFKLQIPFILLSARCDQDHLAEQIVPFRARLFAKPFMPSRLMAEVEQLLESSASMR